MIGSVRSAFLALLMLLAIQAVWAEDTDWPLSSRLLDSFSEGNTARVISEAPSVLVAEPDNHDLRLALAHSLSWSGNMAQASLHYKALLGTELDLHARWGLANALAWSGQSAQAIPFYQSLKGSALEKDSQIGLANACRWSGRPDLALPLYQAVQDREPNNVDAKQGLELSSRELRPRSWLATNTASDNAPMQRNEWIVGHRWRSPGATTIFSLEQSTFSDSGATGNLQSVEQIGRIEFTDWLLKPLITLTQEVSPSSNTLGHVRLHLGDGLHFLNLGQINWGKQAFNLSSLQLALTAHQTGIDSTVLTSAGSIHTVLNRFDISDGNRIDEAAITYTPTWRPAGQHIRTNIGTAWRYANRIVENYWSPTDFVVAFAGFSAQWNWTDGEMTAYLTTGATVTNSSTPYWAAGASVLHWINKDWQMNGYIGSQTSTQGARYRSNSLGLRLERLW